MQDSNPDRFQKFITWFAAAVAVFHIWANTFGNLSELWRNSLHLGMLGALGFLLYPSLRNKRPEEKIPKWGLVLAGLVLASCLYLIFFEEALHNRNEIPVLMDLVFAAIAVLLTLELTRRTSGFVIPFLAIFLLSYALWWGSHVGGVFGFRGMNISRVLYRMYFTDEGLFGMIASISSTYVFMFVLFAAFLLRSGGGDFIIKVARSFTRKLTGGPGLVAVFASGLMGTISGSAVANTVSTGAITIPLMKKAGYSPRFAAAVESAASTGGQLMPPIMGAGAFIMSQWTQIPYPVIISAALLPAILYFSSVGFYVYLEAKKSKLDRSELLVDEPLGKIIREGLHFFIPIFILIGMLIADFTPTYAAGFSILAVVLSSWMSRRKMGGRDILDALALGTRNMIATGVLLVASGIIVGVINMTGISITFSQLVVDWSGQSLLLALVLIAVASLLLGMGLPVTAAYIMIAILTVPALTNMGVPLLAAHMVVFWLSQDSNVTPPVCLASFAASSISGSHPMATGLTSWKLAKSLYIMPLLFAYTGLISGDWSQRFTVFAFALVGLYAVTVAFTGFMFRSESISFRILISLAALGLFWPGNILVNLAGLGLFLALGFFSRSRIQRGKPTLL